MQELGKSRAAAAATGQYAVDEDQSLDSYDSGVVETIEPDGDADGIPE